MRFSFQFFSHIWLFVIPWTAVRQDSLSITNTWSLFKFMSTEAHAIHPSCPLSSPSPPAFNLSQHFFQWVSSSNQGAKVLEFQLQHQSFQWTPRTDFLEHGLVGSPCSPRDSQESSPTPQFKSINYSAFSFLYGPTLMFVMTTRKIIALTRWIFVVKQCFCFLMCCLG